MVVEPQFPLKSLLKVSLFSKRHIYSERGDFGASSYDKISTSLFVEKMGFCKEGGPLNIFLVAYSK